MKGFIYIIRSHLTDDVYYGSTKTKLSQRMAEHRRQYKQWINETFRYVTSFEIIKYDDAYIELVEELEYENKLELLAREGFYIRNNNCINKHIPNRTQKEYYEDNNEKIKERHKQYNIDNKEQITKYRIDNKEKAKQYRIDNKEKANEYAKQYYLKKKQNILE